MKRSMKLDVGLIEMAMADLPDEKERPAHTECYHERPTRQPV
jgi:hypothetical protein